jgi:DNA-binding beta-propeller fold protein YncE
VPITQPEFVGAWGSYGSGPGQFNGPIGVAVDNAGHVYVADARNQRIQKFTADGTFLTMWGTYGSGPGQFKGPSYLAIDAANNVYVTDFENFRVRLPHDMGFLSLRRPAVRKSVWDRRGPEQHCVCDRCGTGHHR